ncbi:nucleoside recognition domain-containing protein [Legionella jamestowniensis]|uniref:Nucleoside recognition protein n=1 Tax=Legionella jamestowniensis TaxID=455 RepID=A0A0W0UHI0_9GAMM|nr:nucleoside recognition domain-containing protein [Legionella jamestowniensis]KTD07180.1 spore maturation protein A [Legionella jamestowniensis]OCH98033.1 nucleoside recognition protein [Legionella jamestowniensis]SFL96204.1 spore maturation protein A [Legionella jamestowniensis DSM 19215]
MLNAIWLSMILLSVIVGVVQGRLDQVVHSVTDSAKMGFEIALGLAGVMTLWLGIMGIASESGLVNRFARLLKPVMRPLFPDVPVEHPAMGAIILNIAANMLGLANAATPFGLQAMRELEKLNKNAHEASDAMCTFLAINTSSVQLIPATAIAFLAANGSTQPSSIIVSALAATMISTIVAIVAVKQLAKLPVYRSKGQIINE